MKPGPELDAKVAEALGWVKNFDGLNDRWMIDGTNHHYVNRAPGNRPTVGSFSPSTDIAAAWGLVEEMLGLDRVVIVKVITGEGWVKCDVTTKVARLKHLYDGYEEEGDTAPHAICLAFLRAKGVEL